MTALVHIPDVAGPCHHGREVPYADIGDAGLIVVKLLKTGPALPQTFNVTQMKPRDRLRIA
jgi:hypothetical protein